MHINGNIDYNISGLAKSLGEAASKVIIPGKFLVVDESLFDFEGKCPVRRYIPRKPHPNGLLSYGLAGYFYVGAYKLPFVLDMEPYVLDNLVGPHEALINLQERLRRRMPLFRPQFVVDAAF